MTYVKDPLVILTGPTAVGKTALSVKLAQKIGGEIISADSMQVYRDMNIGSAKIKEEEMQGIPHHLIDVLSPDEEFNVYTFQQMAKKSLAEIYKNGHIPIVAGGTGFYIQALLYDVDFSEHETEEKYRQELVALEQEKGREYLYEMLKQADPEYAAIVHSNNVKRVIRALEYYHETGRKLSEHNAQQRENSSPYQFVYLVLNDEREILYDRIDRRVDQMMEAGLLQEVEALVKEGYERTLVSMQGLGYKEFFDYFDGKCTLEETVDIIKRDTRRFAKRQLTWFRREKEVCWMNKQDYPDGDALFHEILKILKEKEIWNG